MRPTLRRLLVLALLGGLLWSSQRWWRLRTAPPGPVDPATPWPPVPAEPGPVNPVTPEIVETTAPQPEGPGPHEASDQPAHPVQPATRERLYVVSATLRSKTVTPLRGGVDPVDGACPEGYPVKAKQRSRIYHLPGMALYDRTVPDRCYSSAAEAERDGFRQAKH